MMDKDLSLHREYKLIIIEVQLKLQFLFTVKKVYQKKLTRRDFNTRWVGERAISLIDTDGWIEITAVVVIKVFAEILQQEHKVASTLVWYFGTIIYVIKTSVIVIITNRIIIT